MTDLDDWLTPDEDALPPLEGLDTSGLTQWLRKLASLEKQMAANEQMAEAEIKRVKEWLYDRNNGLAQSHAFLSQAVSDFMVRYRDSTKRKSVNTPAGTISTREKSGTFTIKDEAAVIQWARDHDYDQVVKVTEKPVLAELKKLLGEDEPVDAGGELVPGVEYTAPETPYSVTFKLS